MDKVIHRALIVDDEKLLREATSRAMAAERFCCDTACDGQQAIELYRKHRHDLVVTDLRMPNLHGHSLILELLKESEPPRIVVLTGVANSRLVKDLFSRGVQDIVQKPIDFQVFATKMLSIFERDNWTMNVGSEVKVRAGGNHHPELYKLENALEIFSMCIPQPLERELIAHTELVSNPPENLLPFLERLINQNTAKKERRRTKRLPVMTSAVAIPVNKDFVVKGGPSRVTFADLSESGAALFNTRSFETDYIALRWRSFVSPKRFLKAVLQITRCKPIGPFYEIGGQFVMHD